MWVSEAHGFPTKVTIIYLGLVKQPCFNGWLISMNAPSQRRAARFFHIVRPVPSLSGRNWRWTASPFKQGQLCGAEIALLRVKMLPDMKKRSLLAGTEVFAPVYEQIHLLSFIDVWSSWLRKLILNLNYIKLQKDSQRWQSTCRIRTIATLTWNSRIRAKRQQHFSILARCSDCLLIVFLSPGLGMFRNSSWAVSAGFAGQGSTVLLKTASKSSLSCHLLARTVCKAKAHQGTKTYENIFLWVAPGERKHIF